MTDKLTGLAKHTIIVADTGDFSVMKALGAQDSTTNPTLIYRAASQPQYAHMIDDAVAWAAKRESDSDKFINLALDRLAVTFGMKSLEVVPGFVSTEVDIRLSFDTDATVERTKRIIDLYQAEGIDTKRVLIKVAATWEGIKAAEKLTKMGIGVNSTLIFSLTQAIACADAGAFMISPYCGRITEWYQGHGTKIDNADNDPGVVGVRNIQNYMRNFGYKTIVMGASFRNVEQVLGLAGIDRLTVSPVLLQQLQQTEGEVERVLPADFKDASMKRQSYTEASWRWEMNENAMATEKFADGIRLFTRDTETLISMIQSKMKAAA
ncbi:transaldolase [Consotaella salsifontis]|uniref:Transaldolase n=1 Tax=Consotaella salsifontis TaxID=1365950 RepID=A0A1T4RDI6_9HYPH|nr:transaldolase [Consotaella salsifontis]SKA13969.1 transaldolase [Consotaella salsifontis]